jgi:hypothetical protein
MAGVLVCGPRAIGRRVYTLGPAIGTAGNAGHVFVGPPVAWRGWLDYNLALLAGTGSELTD